VVPYEVTFHTGDVPDAGTDSQVFIKVFGVKGSSSDIYMDKMSERFERGKVDLITVTDHDLYVHCNNYGAGNNLICIHRKEIGTVSYFRFDSNLRHQMFLFEIHQILTNFQKNQGGIRLITFMPLWT